MRGKIKSLISAKKFGFITGEDGKSYFFHSSALQNIYYDLLREKMPVSFTPTNSEKGLRAEEVNSEVV